MHILKLRFIKKNFFLNGEWYVRGGEGDWGLVRVVQLCFDIKFSSISNFFRNAI